ncbi:hypothetical protein BDZ97DRAFT_202715 [Flammula alnicola]|nr:hypothetical protein BDZ97DRAFT_202715 [Flammula alnicola]
MLFTQPEGEIGRKDWSSQDMASTDLIELLKNSDSFKNADKNKARLSQKSLSYVLLYNLGLDRSTFLRSLRPDVQILRQLRHSSPHAFHTDEEPRKLFPA